MPSLDQPRPVREPLDRDALRPWLADHLDGAEDFRAGVPGASFEIEQFPSGFSNLTYLVTAGEREVVLRRPPPGADVKSGHDMGREFMLLSALHGHVPVPEPLGYEETGDVLGVPFYVMERVHGTILRSSAPEREWPDAETMERVAGAFADNFARLHALDLGEIGLGDFGRPEGYVRRQVEGWARRYERAQTDDIPALERAFAWLDDHQPPESGAALIHNDYKYDNLVLAPGDLGTVRGILDWELATVGDPLMDLGSTLGYWVEPDDHPALRALALSPTWWPGNPTREELVEQYARATGRTPGDAVVFYYVYGLLKLAVIAQQIYRRWKAGHAQDERFGELIHTVRACGEAAVRAIDRGRLSRLFE